MGLFQAFAISVACMDGKIADRKGYEYMRKLTGAAETTEPYQVRLFLATDSEFQ